ncbi:MAG: transposase, partial [Acinetobacter tjernbergiae]
MFEGKMLRELAGMPIRRIDLANSDALVAFVGLDPRASDSGQKTGRRRLSKRGS